MIRDERLFFLVRKLILEKRFYVINWFGEYIVMRGENFLYI